jgi:hypothetical protein
VTTFDKCAKTLHEHRSINLSSYPGLANAVMSDQIEPSVAAGERESSLQVTKTTYSGLQEHRIIVHTAGVVDNPDASDDPQYQ